MDPATLATTAVLAALSYLKTLGTEVAKAATGAAGKSVWDWVKSRLTSDAGKEVVKDLETSPDDSDNRKAVEAALAKLLKSDSHARSELAQLLGEVEAASTSLVANVVGNENTIGQATGSASVAINKNSAPARRPKAP